MLTRDAVIAEASRDWLTRKGAAALLSALGCPVAYRTLEAWAVDDNSGNGPSFTRVRRNIVRYHRNDIVEWVNREARRIK